MDLELLLKLLDQYGIPLVLIALLTLALVWVMKRLLAAMDERIKRSEALLDTLKPSIDALVLATNEQTAAVKAIDKTVEHLADSVNARLAGGR